MSYDVLSYDSDAEYADSDADLMPVLAVNVDSAEVALQCLQNNSTTFNQATHYEMILVRGHT